MSAIKLALGTAQFGSDYGITNQTGQVKFNEILAILDLAWENGINTMDSAKAYGTSEEVIGNCLKLRIGNKWDIITKVNEIGNSINVQLEDSARKLTIPPAIILAHSVELFLDVQFQKEIAVIRDQQMIKKIGVSLYSEDEINKVINSDFKPEIIQLPLNILDSRLYRNGVLEMLVNQDVEIHARSAFLQGLFYLSHVEINNRFSDAVPYFKKLTIIASKLELTLPELSLLWLVNLEEISKVVIGVENAQQLNSHLVTLKKEVDPSIFEEALGIHYQNESILNPSLWPSEI